MAQYLCKVKELAQTFHNFQLVQINRSLNGHTNALSKLASPKDTTGRTVFIEVLHRLSIEEKEVSCVETEKDWRAPLYKYLTSNELPDDPLEARKLECELRGLLL